MQHLLDLHARMPARAPEGLIQIKGDG